MTGAPHYRTTTRVGEMTVRPVDVARDAELVHSWLTHPAARFWEMGDLTLAQVREYLAYVLADDAEHGWLLHHDGHPIAYCETYDPSRLVLRDVPTQVLEHLPGDIGMHLLVAPAPAAAPAPGLPAEPLWAEGRRISGLTDGVMTTVMRFCLTPAGRGATRVVVEPDARNAAIGLKNAAAGFRVLRDVELTAGGHTKHARLSVCTREDFAASPLGGGDGPRGVSSAAHLRPSLAARAHRHLVAKAIAEFTHERLILPQPSAAQPVADAAEMDQDTAALPRAGSDNIRDVEAMSPAGSDVVRAAGADTIPGETAAREVTHGDAREYELVLPAGHPGDASEDRPGGRASGSPGALLAGGQVTYSFTARRFPLEHWVIDEGSLHSVRRGSDGVVRAVPVDVLDLVAQLEPLLGVPQDLLPVYLEELSATLAGGMAKLERELSGASPSSSDLVNLLSRADIDTDIDTGSDTGADTAGAFQAVEAAMTEGHPSFVANNGRIGFSLADYRAYAPERAERMRLMWLAARRQHTRLALGAGESEEGLYGTELSGAERAAFADRLTARGLDPADYLYLPVHPWQWEHRVAITFAADVAREDLVPLGPGGQEYLPQQSIRTMFNATRPARHYVKVATAIQNMGFLRGLSPKYMRDTPAVNDYVHDLVSGDETLRRTGFTVLREVATIGYTGDIYHSTPANNPYRKMLAALWRQSPIPRLDPHERVATMASLLHRDATGHALVTTLIRASGIPARQWMSSLLDAYLYPLTHCLLAHSMAFMPHGENLVLVLRDHVVRRVLMKDIGEEVAILDDRPLPPHVERIRDVVSDEEKALAIFTDVYDGVLRHLCGILAVDDVLPADQFWALAGATLDRYRDEHPDIAARNDRSTGIDLGADTFSHSCLNRLQLRDTTSMVDLANQSASLIHAGRLTNPAPARP